MCDREEAAAAHLVEVVLAQEGLHDEHQRPQLRQRLELVLDVDHRACPVGGTQADVRRQAAAWRSRGSDMSKLPMPDDLTHLRSHCIRKSLRCLKASSCLSASFNTACYTLCIIKAFEIQGTPMATWHLMMGTLASTMRAGPCSSLADTSASSKSSRTSLSDCRSACTPSGGGQHVWGS